MKTNGKIKLNSDKRAAVDDDAPTTEGKFKFYFENIKELIISVAKATEAGLWQEIHGVRERADWTECRHS